MRRLTDIRFHAGNPLCKLTFDWFNTVGRRLDNVVCVGGTVKIDSNSIIITPGSFATGSSTDFAWNVTGDALTLTVTPGEVELGPDVFIPWTSITGYTTSLSIPPGTTTFFVWVNVDVAEGAEAATMFSGTSITALDSTEKKHIRQKKIAKITLIDDLVTKIERFQCGNIDIPRL